MGTKKIGRVDEEIEGGNIDVEVEHLRKDDFLGQRRFTCMLGRGA